ncbi:MAG: ExbD/TolR family protein [Gammaproteobacteria bacterium]
MATRHATDTEEAEINITPMLDMTFILLIFFIVTTSFVRPPGIQVNRPPAVTAQRLHSSILIGLSPSGQIWMNKEKIPLDRVSGMVESALAQAPKGNVVIIADEDAPSGMVVKLMGQAKLGGATSIALAAKQVDTNGGGS